MCKSFLNKSFNKEKNKKAYLSIHDSLEYNKNSIFRIQVELDAKSIDNFYIL